MLEFIWSTLFSKFVDIASKKLGRVRFEVANFSAEIERAQNMNDSVIILDPYAPGVGDLDLSLDGAFFFDDDTTTGLSQFSFAFKATKDDAKSVMADAPNVIAYPDPQSDKADYSGRVNLPSRQFVEIHIRGSVPGADLASVDSCDALYVSAVVGGKKRKAWKIAEKRDGKWLKV